jgi:Protein of unknown function (DUF3810)
VHKFTGALFFEILESQFRNPKNMKRLLKVLPLSLVPLALLSLHLAFRFPEATEHLYSQGLYPRVVRAFALLNFVDFSWAEVLLVLTLGAAAAFFRPKRIFLTLWAAAGAVLWAFLVLWGFNYARPPLASRLGLGPPPPGSERLLETGSRTAALTSTLYGDLEQGSGPTKLPVSFEELDRLIDDGYRDLRLPGDRIGSRTAPAKPLLSSTLFSYLGVSGIFVPFTGEPSVNALQPDAALPLVLAHEKAHQRGITHEGEASFAAFLVCSRDDAPPYLRYAAYLFATQSLLGESAQYVSREDVAKAWERLGKGPLEDVKALHDFWERYQGAASDIAGQVNDRYLRALRVPEGVESYGTVVRLLLALDAKGELF